MEPLTAVHQANPGYSLAGQRPIAAFGSGYRGRRSAGKPRSL
ncbi:hypothetical protein C4K27_3364 [Pseudomonas chlororaphis subsp. chlororaphis]|nr:hypothetical protein C4K27_3364 [Pseudomonas chlororaphis subsp. chlororaphis]